MMVTEVVDVVAFLAVPGLEYRASWDGSQRVAEPHIVAVVIGEDGTYAAAALSELRRRPGETPGASGDRKEAGRRAGATGISADVPARVEGSDRG